MKVILKKDVPNLGKKLQVVEVSDGYARNYLIPKGLAEVARTGLLKAVEIQKKREEERAIREEREAMRLAERLNEALVEIPVPAGETGRLYHAVSPHEIASAIQRNLGISLERDQIALEEPIRTLGIHTVPVRLHKKVRASVKVNIVPASG